MNMDEQPGVPGPPKPNEPKPIQPPSKSNLTFTRSENICFSLSNMFHNKAMYGADDVILLLFNVDEEYMIMVEQVEYFLYLEEVYRRCADINKTTGGYY